MRKLFFHAAIVAAYALAAIAGRAAAMTPAVPAPPDDGSVQFIANVCGPSGCAPVQTKRVIHHQKQGNTVPHHI